MSETELIPKAERSRTTNVVDTRGLLCPYPFIQAKQALDAVPHGSTVEILTDSEATAVSSIPILAARNGYTFTTTKHGDLWRLIVTKP